MRGRSATNISCLSQMGDFGGGIEKNLRSSLALTAIGSNAVRATEDLEGGVALNTMLGAELGMLSAVNLDELDALLLEGGGGLLVLGGEGLAVSTPGSVDYYSRGRKSVSV
jgi:hypothetical protein